MKRAITSRAVVMLLLLAPCPGLAQAEVVDESVKQQAHVHFARGQELFTAGEYTRAAAAFELAYEIHPHAAVLGNIAMCYDKAGKLAHAVVAYRRYLANPVDAGKNTKMQKRLRELEAMVGELDIECPAKNCRVEVDGIDRGRAPLSVVVLPGSHRVEALSGEKSIAVTNARVGRGEVERIELKAQDEGPVETPIEEQVAPPPPDDADSGATLGAPFWVATGLTAAAGAATIVFGSLAVDAHNRYEDADRLDSEAKEDGERNQLLTNVMIGVTAAAATAATAFAIYDVVTADDETEVAIVPGPGVGIGVAGAF